MATYQPGITDYITQIQPTEPNLQFDAQVLQTKQSTYDANHKKVSQLYGSILNSEMSRSENIQARDEFFRTIQGDIKRMAGLDFSLDSNVNAAAGVFKSIYNNKNIVKDMVWTKNFNNEIQRAEGFKNCIDPSKCGGEYWDAGLKALYYKREEFKNANSDEALNFSNVSYVPYKKSLDIAMKYLKESGLKMKVDSLSSDGRYIITTQNGTQIIKPLTALFSQVIGQDPSFLEMYKTQAYVDRKDWINQKVTNGNYANENEAMVGYMETEYKRRMEVLDKVHQDIKMDKDAVDSKVKILQDEFNSGKIAEGSDKHAELMGLLQIQKSANEADEYLKLVNETSINRNNNASLIATGEMLDKNVAASYLNEDINNNAKLLSMSDSSYELKSDKFAEMHQKHLYDLDLAQKKFEYDKQLEAIKATTSDTKKSSGVYSSDITKIKEEISSFENTQHSEYKKFIKNYYEKAGVSIPSETEIDSIVNGNYEGDDDETANAASAMEYAKKQYESALKIKKINLNKYLSKNGDPFKYEKLVSFNELSDNWNYNDTEKADFIMNYLKKMLPGKTDDVYNTKYNDFMTKINSINGSGNKNIYNSLWNYTHNLYEFAN